MVPTSYAIHEGDEVYAKRSARAWEFEEPFYPRAVEMPQAAVVDRSLY